MKKFLCILFNIVLIASVILSVVFGFLWNGNRNNKVIIPPPSNIEAELREDLEKITIEKENLQNQIDNLNRTIAEKEERITYWYKKFDERWLELQNLTNENEGLRDELLKIRGEFENLVNEQQQMIDDLKAQVSSLENQVNNLQSEIDSFSTLTPITLDFTDEQLQNSTIKMYLSGLENVFGISNFVNIRGSFVRDNQCVIISNIVDGNGNKGLGYTCFVYDVKKELTADYVVELMIDEIFPSRVVSNGVCMSVKGLSFGGNYTRILEYYNSHKTAEYKFAKSINGIDDLFISIKTINSSTMTTYKYSIIAYGDEIPTLYLNGLDKSSETTEDFVINTLDNYRYVEIPDNVTFENSSWELISYLSEKGIAQQYYNVGDKKNIRLSTGEEITLVVLGFNHDDLSNGNGKAGMSIGTIKVPVKEYAYNDKSTNVGGWHECNLRTQGMSEIYSTLPDDLQNVIKAVDKRTTAGNKSTNIIISSDKLWLFSEIEIDGTTKEFYCNEGVQYEYWKTIEPADRKFEYDTGTPVGHYSFSSWINVRSSNILNDYGFLTQYPGGTFGNSSSHSEGSVVFGFCI